MQLESILNRVPFIEIRGRKDRDISQVVTDSRKVIPHSIYVAIKGNMSDGHHHIDEAIKNGAGVIFCEKTPPKEHAEVTYVLVKDTPTAVGLLAKNFYKNPSEKLTLVGITGTNGKTSTVTLLYKLFTALGYKSALISTVENKIGEKTYSTAFTTPDILTLNNLLAEAVEEGCRYAFMEVSSHGIEQKRISGLYFSIGGFTNITHDHLDYHKTFDAYLKVKKSFFDVLSKKSIAVTNLDDKNGKVIIQNTEAKKKSYAQKTLADYHGKIIEQDLAGMHLRFNNKEFWTSLTGRFNASNLLLVYAISHELGIEDKTVLRALSQIGCIKGRFEVLKSDSGIYFVLDYAHTPDAMENLLDSLNEIRTKNERLITVFGCGGDRDREKRPKMGRIVTKKSTLAIITTDNPRNEKPESIIKNIEEGVEAENFGKYVSIVDRREAIKTAIKYAEPKDIILVAGKGHETYQEIAGVKHPFDDKEVLRELTKQMNK
ncbi:MAG: UDP-N-acetylmuramoyl-L-alanyl-D-glutamate--2,6-diaminopimelate ligase [Bergeyella sp.]|nr:UDP-N-acetylmuramoyl-L-alanyl-D-glutamate--2,6-diaminopimelate ligase [Bergeyella sp.]